jgi:hypothetical protein
LNQTPVVVRQRRIGFLSEYTGTCPKQKPVSPGLTADGQGGWRAVGVVLARSKPRAGWPRDS